MTRMICLLSLWFFSLWGIRDPFSPATHSYCYTAYGISHSKGQVLGILWIDGLSRYVREGDAIEGYTVKSLTEKYILLESPTGSFRKITKKPSELKKS